MSHRSLIPGAAVAAALLSACTPVADPEQAAAEQAAFLVETERAALRDYFADTTSWVSASPRGTFITHHAADGTAQLWSPATTRTATSAWRIEHDGGAPDLCYFYPEGSTNPATDAPGGAWECSTVDALLADKTWFEGDPFGLADGVIPFVLDRGTYEPLIFAPRAGLSPDDLIDLTAERDTE
ncbi:MAG: hypothetical protein AAGJ96_08185 [Pseudomonadota bacterium]